MQHGGSTPVLWRQHSDLRSERVNYNIFFVDWSTNQARFDKHKLCIPEKAAKEKSQLMQRLGTTHFI
uniref:Uncharacterized protein n=1 Tax=Trichogramma kaykai TaxID=54128 RepID=A0ABD2WE17_9HYME